MKIEKSNIKINESTLDHDLINIQFTNNEIKIKKNKKMTETFVNGKRISFWKNEDVPPEKYIDLFLAGIKVGLYIYNEALKPTLKDICDIGNQLDK